MQKKAYYILALLMCTLFSKNFSQSTFPDIDKKWEAYYNQHPSAINTNYQATDFINVIELVGFVPVIRELKGNVQILKKALLSLSEADLNQMRIDGNYYSKLSSMMIIISCII